MTMPMGDCADALAALDTAERSELQSIYPTLAWIMGAVYAA
jgi:hypothetical protein